MKCFGGWGKREPGEAREEGGQQGGTSMGEEGPGGGEHGQGRTGRGGGTSEEGPGEVGSTGEERPGGEKLDMCILHQVHTSVLKRY